MDLGGVLFNRLLPPRLAPGLLARSHITERILGGLNGRLVTVLAGAGYGKSTAVAQAVAGLPDQVVWVSCDRRLIGAPDLIAHISAGFARVVTGRPTGFGLAGSVESQIGTLCNELVATFSDDTVLVLDDVHLLNEDANEVVFHLLRDLPPWVHLVLVGRAPLPFPLGKIRAGQLVEVTQADLELDRDEVASVWLGAGGADDPETVSRVFRATEGWMTGVVLAAQEGHIDVPRSADVGHAFGYFAEEVFDAQPPVVQDFLLQTAVLARFSPDLAVSFTGDPQARAMSREVVDRHLFAVRCGAEGESCRYHHLFRAFLRHRLAEQQTYALTDLHRRAAEAWVAEQQPAEAVNHLIAAGDTAAAAELLGEISTRQGRFHNGGHLARDVGGSVPFPGLGAVPSAGNADGSYVGAGARPIAAVPSSGERPPLEICGLGGFVVRRGGEVVPISAFGRERARALLAALVCTGGPVHRERLLEWLWPDLDVGRGLRALYVTLHALRRALEPDLGRGAAGRSVIRSEGETYRLVLREGDTVDVDVFLELSRPIAGHDERAMTARLHAAERIHTGELYPDWPYAEWAQERRRQVERAYATTLEHLADCHLAADLPHDAVLRLERLVAVQPEREESHRRLMLAYAYAGEKALALRQYHACRAMLRRELGVEASPETRALYQVILEDGPLPRRRVPALV